MTEQQIADFNQFYEKACAKMEGLIMLGDYRPKAIGFFHKLKANKAIKYFNQALAIYPQHFQSLFLLGKLYQRLGDYEKSLSYLEASLTLEKTNHNIPQEASLVAMHLNQVDKAIEYSKEALQRNPGDIALLGNHSMNLLIAGLDDEAKNTIDKAVLLNPEDTINQRIKAKVYGIIEGREQRPTFKDSIG